MTKLQSMTQGEPRINPAVYRRPRYDACVFCGSTTEMTHEDVIPKWLQKMFGTGPDTVSRVILNFGDRSLPLTRKAKPARGVVLRTRAVCKGCNGGWMKRLEDRGGPHISDLVSGQPMTIGAVTKEAIATWAMKTAMMAGFRFGKPPSPETARAFMRTQESPLGSVVWIGHLHPGPVVVGVEGLEAEVQDYPARTMKGFVSFLGLGHVAIIVFLNPRSRYEIDMFADPPAFDPRLFQVWPIGLDALTWPPSVGITTKQLNVGIANLIRIVAR